jgi:hypothetical protein
LRKALAAGVALAFIMSFAGAAEAAYRKSSRSYSISKPGKKREVAIKEPFGELPKGPLQMVVSIGQQHVTLYANGVRVGQSKVSTGTASHPTPTGVFSVIEKDRWHRSNLYDNAPMFYMQRLTWSGVAMHEGILPGYAASHGCIRLPTDFASRLWLITRLGVRVVVARNDPAPYEFDHPKLFSPMQKPAAKISEAQPSGEGLRPTIATAELGIGKHPIVFAQSTVIDDSGHGTDTPEQSPVQSPDSPEAAPPPAPPPIEEIIASTPKSETLKSETLKSAEERPAPIGEVAPPSLEPAAAETTEAPAAAPATQQAAETPSSAEPEKREPVEAEPRKPVPPRSRAGEPPKRAGQVAVFISKQEKKVFVRQGFLPVFDMPIEIADPDQPLGTHVFTAMEFKDDGARIRWNAITMPPDQARPVDRRGKHKAGKRTPEPAPTVEAKTPSTAAEALDRIKLPQEAIERIGELVTPGSSLVVSDHGLGRETGRYTEFIVLTR